MIEIDDLEKIIGLVERCNFSHFEFEQESSKVIIERDISGTFSTKKSNVQNKEKSLENIEMEKNQKKEDRIYIKSTMAGTFYLKKEESADPFVKLHDNVEEDTVVGLVEVMKLFNEIEAGVKGEIINILVKDGDFVEYGQPLFEVKGSDS